MTTSKAFDRTSVFVQATALVGDPPRLEKDSPVDVPLIVLVCLR